MLINITIVASIFLSLFAGGEFLYHFLHVRAEVSRKFVHIFTGIFTFLLPTLIGDHRIVLALCASFALLLFISKKLGFLKSINAIDRPSQGSLWYPLIIYMCYYVYYISGQYIYFYLPIFILAISDPIAALSGKKWQLGKYTLGCHTKTIVGSVMFFLSSFILSVALLVIFTPITLSLVLLIAFIISFSTTLAEALSRNGLDNFTIPATALFILLLVEKLTLLF